MDMERDDLLRQAERLGYLTEECSDIADEALVAHCSVRVAAAQLRERGLLLE